MTITEFVEKAVEGGWFPKNSNWTTKNSLSWRKQAVVNRAKFIERYLLDPLAWQAVGRVEGWEDYHGDGHECMSGVCSCHESITWLGYMHRMVDALAEGKTIEEYIATL